ncbi:MAG TPA: hypothetical protein VK625_09965, partial [Flavitalea sp.]|nr:hypothetical protein [Flavitalea sp.]
VQRTQEGKLKAKRENRTLTDADIKTACQQACAADSIVFGNANNPDSEISKIRRDNSLRVFHSLEQLHVMPSISYLAKVRNTDAISAHSGEEEHHAQSPAATGAQPEHH